MTPASNTFVGAGLALPARLIGKRAAIFVVGMGSDLNQAGARLELAKALAQRDRPTIDRERYRVDGWARCKVNCLLGKSSGRQNRRQGKDRKPPK